MVPSLPSSPALSTSSSPVFPPHTFSNLVSFKLPDDNFLLWQQEALATIKGHNLQHHLRKDAIPQMYSSTADADSSKVSVEFAQWERQDNHLLSWLLALLSVWICMVGCLFSYQVWEKIKKFFCSQTRAKVWQLKVQLKGIKKTKSVNSYLLDLKKIIDQLAVVGASVTTEEYIEIILDGLPVDYNPFITFIISRLDSYSIDEMEALLLAVEARIEKCNSSYLIIPNFSTPIQAHMAQHNSSSN